MCLPGTCKSSGQSSGRYLHRSQSREITSLEYALTKIPPQQAENIRLRRPDSVATLPRVKSSIGERVRSSEWKRTHPRYQTRIGGYGICLTRKRPRSRSRFESTKAIRLTKHCLAHTVCYLPCVLREVKTVESSRRLRLAWIDDPMPLASLASSLWSMVR